MMCFENEKLARNSSAPRNTRVLAIALAVSALSVLGDRVAAEAVASSTVTAQVQTDPRAVVAEFHSALARGDKASALDLLDPQVIIFEQGGAEMSRDEYASRHLDADVEFTRSVATKIADQKRVVDKQVAWVMTLTETTGSFHGKDVASRGTETMVLHRRGAAWKITHIHWSSHPREK